MKKYDPLCDYLKQRKGTAVTLTFSEIEEIIQSSLPESAHKYVQWWSNCDPNAHSHASAWLDAGFKTVNVFNTIGNEIIRFE